MFLQINHVSKQFDGHIALDDVTFSVPEGSIYGLLGPNGAGKTTLLRLINRILLPDSGEILFQNRPLTFSDGKKIGYLPEERGLYRKMKVGEQALYLAQLKGMSRHDATTELKKWFEKFELGSWWNRTVSELSKGMAQKVQFITTVVHRPQLLIFDEPFSGFDPVNTEMLRHEILEQKNNGATIILATHNMESVESLCSQISLLNQSKLVLQGEINAIRERYKTNSFCFVVGGEYDSEVCSFAPYSQKFDGEKSILHFNLKNQEEIRQLLAAINSRYTILHFEEEIPRMNEIFIKLVSKKTTESR